MTTRRFASALGEISYADRSDGPAEASVVLLHAVGGSTHLWDEVVPVLAPHARVITVDLLGHGRSGDPPRDLTIPDHVDVVAALLRETGADPALLVGTSLGALIALDLTARHPDLVSALVLNGCPGWHSESQRMDRLIAMLERLGPDGRPGPDFALGGTVSEPAGALAERRRADLDRCGRAFAASWWAIASFDPLARLGLISCPTRIVMGEADFHLAMAHTLVDGIRAATLATLPGAGHLSPFDDPEGVAHHVLAMVKTET